MRWKYMALLSLLLLPCKLLCVISLSIKDIDLIAEKIWKNECSGTVEGLTSWNKGENFASMGIGHFIWYPKGKKGCYEETFPNLVKYIKNSGITVPKCCKTSSCPWRSREEFYLNSKHPDMVILRSFLLATKHIQAEFMIIRLEKAFPLLIQQASPKERNSIQNCLNKLSNEPKGLYALIDYLNFKGMGISPSETYNGQGWGLLQVLQGMESSSQNVVEEFVNSAIKVLERRVKNAPPDRHEERWLVGWRNRVNTYLY